MFSDVKLVKAVRNYLEFLKGIKNIPYV